MGIKSIIESVASLQTYEDVILHENDIKELCAWQSRFLSMQKAMRVARASINPVCDMEADALDILESLEGEFARLYNDCDKYIALIEDQIAEQEEYGSYSDQVRETYYKGQL